MIARALVVTWSSGNKDGTFLNQIINNGQNMAFSAWSTTAVTIGDLEIATSTKEKKKKELWQNRLKGKLMLELFLDSSRIVQVEFIPEGAKRALLQDPSPCT
jgi:hypothetical protein